MDQVFSYFKKPKNAFNLLVLAVLTLALPLGLQLVKKEQIFQSRARVEAVEIVDGDCVEVRDGKKVLTCTDVPLKLISPIGGVRGESGNSTPQPRVTATPRVTSTPSPTPQSTTACNSNIKTADGKPVLNIKNFNNNIQLAIDCFKDLSLGGGAVYIPSGTYTISKKISVYSNVTIFGDGKDKTIITTSSTSEGGMSNDSSKGQDNIVIRDLTLKGPGNKGGTCCYGLKLENLSNSYVIEVASDNWGMDGIYLGYKLKDGQPRGVTNTRIHACRTNNNDRNGISLTHASNNVIDNCRVENNNADPVKRASGIDLEPDDGLNVSNNQLSENVVLNNKGNGIGLGPFPGANATVANNGICNNQAEGNAFADIAGYKGNYFVSNHIEKFEQANCENDCRKGTFKDNCEAPLYRKTRPPIPPKPISQIPIFQKIANFISNFSFELISEVFAGCSSDEDCGGGERGGTAYCDKHNSEDGTGTCKSQGKVKQKKTSSTKSKTKTTVSATSTPRPTQALASATATPTPSPSQTASSTPQPTAEPIYTAFFKVAESEQGLRAAQELDYDDEPTIYNYELQNSNPGIKQIWVEFTNSEGRKVKKHINIELVEEDPDIDDVSCRLDLGQDGVVFDISGKRFGGRDGGRVIADGENLAILAWQTDSIVGILGSDQVSRGNEKFDIKILRSDGQESVSVPCMIGITQLSLGTEVFCREKGNSELDNVQVIFIDEEGNKIQEVGSLDKDGLITGLKTKLEVGKRYLISIKPSIGLRRNSVFTASSGTTVLQREDEEGFILPLGDIFPANGGDAIVNTQDRGELNRQWKILDTSALSGDFNKDGKINSIDWACMRHSFGESDESLPNSLPKEE